MKSPSPRTRLAPDTRAKPRRIGPPLRAPESLDFHGRQVLTAPAIALAGCDESSEFTRVYSMGFVNIEMTEIRCACSIQDAPAELSARPAHLHPARSSPVRFTPPRCRVASRGFKPFKLLKSDRWRSPAVRIGLRGSSSVRVGGALHRQVCRVALVFLSPRSSAARIIFTPWSVTTSV
jgi:hypothetical protein